MEINTFTDAINELDWRLKMVEAQRPDYISWHSVERIQELETWVRKAGKTINGLKHQSDLAADYAVGLEKRITELEGFHYKNPLPAAHYYDKPHTCGECMNPYRIDKNRMNRDPVGMICIDSKKVFDFGNPLFVREDSLACDKFQQRGSHARINR